MMKGGLAMGRKGELILSSVEQILLTDLPSDAERSIIFAEESRDISPILHFNIRKAFACQVNGIHKEIDRDADRSNAGSQHLTVHLPSDEESSSRWRAARLSNESLDSVASTVVLDKPETHSPPLFGPMPRSLVASSRRRWEHSVAQAFRRPPASLRRHSVSNHCASSDFRAPTVDFAEIPSRTDCLHSVVSSSVEHTGARSRLTTKSGENAIFAASLFTQSHAANTTSPKGPVGVAPQLDATSAVQAVRPAPKKAISASGLVIDTNESVSPKARQKTCAAADTVLSRTSKGMAYCPNPADMGEGTLERASSSGIHSQLHLPLGNVEMSGTLTASLSGTSRRRSFNGLSISKGWNTAQQMVRNLASRKQSGSFQSWTSISAFPDASQSFKNMSPVASSQNVVHIEEYSHTSTHSSAAYLPCQTSPTHKAEDEEFDDCRGYVNDSGQVVMF